MKQRFMTKDYFVARSLQRIDQKFFGKQSSLVEILSDYLQYDDEGNKRIYVPAIIFVSKGEIVGFDDETSYDTHGFDNPEDYWTDEEVSDLKKKLTNYMSEVLDNRCTDCNKQLILINNWFKTGCFFNFL